jgi:hypothetical protein
VDPGCFFSGCFCVPAAPPRAALPAVPRTARTADNLSPHRRGAQRPDLMGGQGDCGVHTALLAFFVTHSSNQPPNTGLSALLQ